MKNKSAMCTLFIKNKTTNKIELTPQKITVDICEVISNSNLLGLTMTILNLNAKSK